MKINLCQEDLLKERATTYKIKQSQKQGGEGEAKLLL